MARRYPVARTEEIPPGTRKRVTVAGRPVAVFNLGGEYFALLDRCPHQGASLCEGKLTGLATSPAPGRYAVTRKGEILRCPWHGWEFDIRTGQSWFDPAHTKVRTYAAAATAGAELVQGPYRAETFPVSVEETYVVVEM